MALPANNNVVGYLQAGSYTAQQDRQVHAVLTQRGGALAHGVIWADALHAGNKSFETSSTGGMGISVAPGYAMVSGYSVYVPAATALTIAAATATARRDAIILHVYDVEKGDADNGAVVEIVKGTTTTDPVLPSGSLLLAHVDLPANAVSITQANIGGRRQYTAAAGGLVLLPDAVITDAQAQQMSLGSLAYNGATGKTYQQRGYGASDLAEFPTPPVPYVPPKKEFYIAGGFNTNGTGDVTVQCSGLSNVEGVICTVESGGPYFVTRVTGAPAGYVWLRVWYAGGAGGAVILANNFIVMDVYAWGT